MRQRATLLARLGVRSLSPHPLRSVEPIYDVGPFYVISSGRSGTTLLRAMLLQNEAVHVPPEMKLLPTLVDQYVRLHRHMPWGIAVQLFGATLAGSRTLVEWDLGLRAFYDQATSLPRHQRSLASLLHLLYVHHGAANQVRVKRWGDKTPLNIRHMSTIDRIFPDSKFVHMLRDGRDVVASIYALGWFPTLKEACDAWLVNTQCILNYAHRQDSTKFHQLRYEDLVTEPERVISTLCAFLDISFKKEMLQWHLHVGRLGHEAKQPHHAGLAKPLNTGSVRNWTRRLDPGEQRYVEMRLAAALETTGYAR